MVFTTMVLCLAGEYVSLLAIVLVWAIALLMTDLSCLFPMDPLKRNNKLGLSWPKVITSCGWTSLKSSVDFGLVEMFRWI